MIELRKVSKSFSDNVLFDQVSFKFNEQKCKIKGLNGTGKSVLLKIIVGFSVPNTGEVYYDGLLLGSESDFLPNAGISINAPEFMKNWSGMENLMYLAKIKNISDKNKIDELVEYFGLKKDIKKQYKAYSLGMKQKMRIIQALMDEPKYLILDEPFDALDQDSKNSLKNYLNKYLSENINRQLIFTSHEEEDDSFAQEIVFINNKKIIVK